MPLSNSVIRRYTPPTCTLEVVAHSSPLSRWMGRPVLKDLRFELRFDDPRLPEEQRIVIRGDRDQLEVLCAAVSNYVQNLLVQPPDHFYTNFLGSASKGVPPLDPREFNHSSFQTMTLDSSSAQMPGSEIYIQPGSGLSHDLFLGSLAITASAPVIRLSVLQLFDLATALDEYSADVVALPTLSRPRIASVVPAWAGVAAVLVIAVGAIPVTMQLANRPAGQKEQVASTGNQPQPETALQPAPGSLLSTPLPTLTSPDQLPPLPPLGSTASPPPTSTFPITGGPPVVNFPATTPRTVPTTPRNTTPFATAPGPQVATKPSTRQGNEGLAIPGGPVFQTGNARGTRPGALPDTSPTIGEDRRSATETPTASGGAALTSPAPAAKIPPNLEAASPPVAATPSPTSTPNATPTPTPNATLAEPTAAPTVAADTASPPASNENSSNSAGTGNNTTAFDTIPQVAEAREYFKQRWQPPAGLTQTLEYSLLLDVDGTVQRILPLGQAARKYIDRTPIPLIGTPFVSPNKSGQSPRVRVVLYPDGKVQTFLESD